MIQYSAADVAEADSCRGVLDAPPEPVIGLAGGETRWRGMTVGRGANSHERYDGVAKNITRRKCVYSDSSTMIATNTITAIGGVRIA